MKRTLHIKYSRVGTIPVAGYVFLAGQVCLLKVRLTTTFYLSAKDKRYIKHIISATENNFDNVVCDTLLIGHPLVFFTKPITLAITQSNVKRLNLYEETMYNRALWSIVTASLIEQRTMEYFHSLWSMDFSKLIPFTPP
jgi:hypothetical protein